MECIRSVHDFRSQLLYWGVSNMYDPGDRIVHYSMIRFKESPLQTYGSWLCLCIGRYRCMHMYVIVCVCTLLYSFIYVYMLLFVSDTTPKFAAEIPHAITTPPTHPMMCWVPRLKVLAKFSLKSLAKVLLLGVVWPISLWYMDVYSTYYYSYWGL